MNNRLPTVASGNSIKGLRPRQQATTPNTPTRDYIAQTLAQSAGVKAVWGGVVGTLADQTDLQDELDGKLNNLVGYLVSTLPAAGTIGRLAYVTDATAPTFLGTLVGGGAVVTPVFDNGSAWVSF